MASLSFKLNAFVALHDQTPTDCPYCSEYLLLSNQISKVAEKIAADPQFKVREELPASINDLKLLSQTQVAHEKEKSLDCIRSIDKQVDAKNPLVIPGITMEFYRELHFFSHAALRITDEGTHFWQMELEAKSEYDSIKDPLFKKLGIKGTFMGLNSSMGDVVLYNDSKERASLEKDYTHQNSFNICRANADARQSLSWYKECLSGAADNYTKEAFNYNFVTHNCGHFIEEIMNKCGLTNCNDFPKTNGLFHKRGILDLPKASSSEILGR